MTHEELIELYETWQSADNPNASDVLKRWADACSALRLPCAAGDDSIPHSTGAGSGWLMVRVLNGGLYFD
jgi:hypothetical protein